jgi:hypothetical protein
MSASKPQIKMNPPNAELLSELPGDLESDSIPAWELVDTGRYMPRRIRGSFRGRELG